MQGKAYQLVAPLAARRAQRHMLQQVASLANWANHATPGCCLRAAELGGTCTLCGAKIALVHGVRSEERAPAAERRAGHSAAAGSSAGASGDAAATEQAAEAVAFKDRLVRAASAPACLRSVSQVRLYGVACIGPHATCA